MDISLRVREGGILVDVLDSGTEMAERLQGLLGRNPSQGQVTLPPIFQALGDPNRSKIIYTSMLHMP